MSKPKPTQEQLLILGDTLRRAREANGFTLEKLAELIDCSARWLQKLETGKSNPHWLTLLQLSGMPGIDVQALIQALGLGASAFSW